MVDTGLLIVICVLICMWGRGRVAAAKARRPDRPKSHKGLNRIRRKTPGPQAVVQGMEAPRHFPSYREGKRALHLYMHVCAHMHDGGAGS